MRMWMVNPKKMCKKHLLGEHVECHMMIGAMKKDKSIVGYLKNGLMNPMDIVERHNALSEEMIKRGYNHKSPMSQGEVEVIEVYLRKHPKFNIRTVDPQESIKELCKRCPDCGARIEAIKDE